MICSCYSSFVYSKKYISKPKKIQKLRIKHYANPTTALIITCTVDQVITARAFSFTCEVHAYLVGKDG